MAIKTNKPAGTSAAETTLPEQPGTDVTEEQPQRGGSFVRNTDGTLTQTEGHGFAPNPHLDPLPPAGEEANVKNIL